MRKVSMREAMHNITKQTLMNYMLQFTHPIGGPLRILFDIKLEFGSFSKNLYQNKERIHGKIRKYVQDRKNGITKSKMNEVDMLSVFLKESETFTES